MHSPGGQKGKHKKRESESQADRGREGKEHYGGGELEDPTKEPEA